MAKEKFYLRPARVLEHVVSPTATPTTLTAAAAKGATSLTVASITGIVDGATIFVGAGETVEQNTVSGSPSGSTVTLARGLGQAHVIAERVVPGITYDFGDPSEDGVKISIDGESTDVNLATTRKAMTILRGYQSAIAEWANPYWTLQVVASALGIKQTRVTGAGTTNSPYQLLLDGTQAGEDIDRGLTVIGKLADGTDFVVEYHGVDKDYTSFSANLRQGTLAAINNRAVACSMVTFATVVPTYTVDLTKKPTKSKVFNLPSEFGVFATAGTPMNTTLGADAAAAATSFTVGDSTNGAAGDRVLLSSGEDEEIVIVATVPNGTSFTSRNATAYAHANGTTAVEQQSVKFGAPTDEGLTLTIGGTMKDVALATERFKGVLPATVTMSMAFMLGNIELTAIANALGVPTSDISSGRLHVKSNLGTSDISRAYFRGLNQGGGTIEINAFGCTQEIKGIAPALSGKDVAKLPITLRPSTLQLLQY